MSSPGKRKRRTMTAREIADRIEAIPERLGDPPPRIVERRDRVAVCWYRAGRRLLVVWRPGAVTVHRIAERTRSSDATIVASNLVRHVREGYAWLVGDCDCGEGGAT